MKGPPTHGPAGLLKALVTRGLRPDGLLVAAALSLELDRWAYEREST
jgi:hypothetical protein